MNFFSSICFCKCLNQGSKVQKLRVKFFVNFPCNHSQKLINIYQFSQSILLILQNIHYYIVYIAKYTLKKYNILVEVYYLGLS